MTPRVPTRLLKMGLLKVALILALLLTVPAQNERHVSVYAPSTVYSVAIVPRGGQDYVSLSEVLEPLGSVEAKADGNKWRLRFTAPGANQVSAEFQQGKKTGKIRGRDLPLAGVFFVENGRGYVPFYSLGDIVGMLTGQMTVLQQGSGRLLVGHSGIRYSMDLRIGNPPRLVLSFQSPVNPTISTEPGKVRLTFRRDPVVSSGPDNVTLGHPVIMSAGFSETNGLAQITVNTTAPLNATFADGNRTIILAPAPTSAASASPGGAQPAATATPPAQNASTGQGQPTQGRFLVVIDAAHGGDDRGAVIGQGLAEKDITLALARKLQHELQSRGIAASMLRQGDSSVALDDRAVAANVTQPTVYIGVHAASLGTGVRVFTAMMASSTSRPRTFVSWDSAQSGFLDASSDIAGSIAAELNNRKIPVRALQAPLRPMRNVAAPAVAIEVAPPGQRPEQISSTEYQQSVAGAVAQGIAALRSKLAGAR